jgi:acetyl esterase/lipase
VLIHVGEDEISLDDALAYAERATAAGVDAMVHVWRGMTHVFPAGVGAFGAADEALAIVGTFLMDA